MSERIAGMAKQPEGAEPVCSFCGNRNSQAKLIAGPAIMICADCVARCMEIAREGDEGVQSTAGAQSTTTAQSVGNLTQVPNPPDAYRVLSFLRFGRKRRPEPACNFCGTPGRDLVQPPSPLGTHGLICNQCLNLCQDIIQEHLR
jgi:ATP-dependent protease Clp ATPase subunit